MRDTFPPHFAHLTGHQPLPWQEALFLSFVEGEFPDAIDLPTGLGKTSVIAVWLPNSIAPGKSRITGMCPTIVHRDGEPVLALGAPGGTRIITGVTQVMLNVLDHGMSAVEAVSAPRFDCQSDILDAEARIPSWVRAELADRGFEIFPSSAPYGPFALVQAIARDPATGALSGGADPRSGGAAMGV